MRKKVAVFGGPGIHAGDFEVVDVGDESAELSGADVVVASGADEAFFESVRDRAPNAVVIVVGDDPHAACETTLFPRARIIGVEEREAQEIVETVVFDRRREFESVVRCQGERGIEDDFARVPVLVGGRGVVEIVET